MKNKRTQHFDGIGREKEEGRKVQVKRVIRRERSKDITSIFVEQAKMNFTRVL